MHGVDPGEDFGSWRLVARDLLCRGVRPESVAWEAPSEMLFAAPLPPPDADPVTVPPAFLELARTACCHADPRRWGVLYRLLWRLSHGGERHLLSNPGDEDVALLRRFERNVRREIHKMHAFVRFRKAGESPDGRERFVAWFEPEHRVVAEAAPFFRKRFANMDWSIFTPKGCAHWIGGNIDFTPGVLANPCDDADALEAVWCTYYRSIFNPARLKVRAMQSEMPKRYWKNLPEAPLIDELVRASRTRVEGMLEEPLRPAKPAPDMPYLLRLRELSRPADVRTDCSDPAAE